MGGPFTRTRLMRLMRNKPDSCHWKYLRQRGWLVALTAISSGTFVTSLLGVALDKRWAALITSFIALAATATNLGTKIDL